MVNIDEPPQRLLDAIDGLRQAVDENTKATVAAAKEGERSTQTLVRVTVALYVFTVLLAALTAMLLFGEIRQESVDACEVFGFSKVSCSFGYWLVTSALLVALTLAGLRAAWKAKTTQNETGV